MPIKDKVKKASDRVQTYLKKRKAPIVLVADDDADVRTLCEAALSKYGLRVELAADGREALKKIKKHKYACVVLDLMMPHMHGATVLAVLQREDPEILSRLIVMTGAPEGALADIKDLVADVLRKPVSLKVLVGSVMDRMVSDDTIREKKETRRR